MEQQTSPQWTASRRRNFGAARHLTLRTFTPELCRRFVEMAIAVQPPRLIDTVGGVFYPDPGKMAQTCVWSRLP